MTITRLGRRTAPHPLTGQPAAPSGSFATMQAAADAVVIPRIRAAREAVMRDARKDAGMQAGVFSDPITGTWTINSVACAIELVVASGPVYLRGACTLGSLTNDTQSLVVVIDGDLVVDANAILTAAARKRGMFIFVRGRVYVAGTIDMHGKGAASVAGYAIQVTTNRGLPSAGAAGATAQGAGLPGVAGAAGTNGQTGGGATGGVFNSGTAANGGTGTTFSGGSGSGGSNTSAAAGAPGANAGVGGDVGSSSPGNDGTGSGNGQPNSTLAHLAQTTASSALTNGAELYGPGGVIWLHARGDMTVAASGIVKSNGGQGGSQTVGGGGSGAGSVNLTSELAAPTVSGTLQANGVANIAGAAAGGTGGAGTTRAVTA